MALRGKLLIEGQWRGWDRQLREQLAAGNTAALRQAAEGLKGDMRRTVRAAGLGSRLGFAITVETYPRGRNSLEPAAVLRARGSSAERVFEAYMRGVTIRSKRGWLAIPVVGNLPVLGRGVKPTPDLVERKLGRPLRWVKVPGKRLGLLVADDVLRGRRSGRVRAARLGTRRKSTQGGYVRDLVMFVLVPQVDVRKRLEFGPLVLSWLDRLPRLVVSGANKGV